MPIPDRRLRPLAPAAAIEITFDGHPLAARSGETVAAALLARGITTFRTMPRSGEPRGGYCLVGRCSDCLVQVDGLPNVRACVTPVAPGMRIATQRGLGEFALPAGDPIGAAPAAFAAPAGEGGRSPTPEGCQVAVVGGGPAGLAAAVGAAEAGARVTLLDEWPDLGGRLRYESGPLSLPWRPDESAPAPILADGLIDHAVALGVDLRPASVVWGVLDGTTLGVAAACPATTEEAGARRPISSLLQPGVLILAPGSTDLPHPFPGATLPGVWSARALLILLNRDRVLPGRRLAILGTGPEAAAVAAAVARAGIETAATVDPTTAPVGAEGDERVRAILIDGKRIPVDLIAVAVGRQPDAALALMAGVGVGFEPLLGGHVPALDDRLRTTTPAIFVAGDAAGPADPTTALAEGRLAGLAAAATVGLAAPALAEAETALARAAAARLAARRRLGSVAVQAVA